jgi:hypothetical protein
VSVRWSRLRAVTVTGRQAAPEAVAVTYQARSDGGCDNTTVRVEDDAIAQDTNAERAVPNGSVLQLAR